MSFTKITSEDTTGKGVVGLPDTPGLETGVLQAKFDELATDVIIPKFNNLVDELDDMGFEKNISSPTITDMRLSADNTLQVSTDGGETYKETASSGHKIMNGAGATFEQRSRLQFSANTVVTDNAQDGITFVSIPSGQKGDKGDAATIQIGSVESGDYASVENIGSNTDAVFNFTLPKGNPGDAATIQVGTVISGENPTVANRGTSSNAIFDFVLPKGEKGDPGTGLTLLGEYPTLSALQAAHPVGVRGQAYYVGNADSGVVYIWDVDANAWSNIGAMKGSKGDTGAAGTVAIGTVTEGNTVAVENVGTSENAILNFTLKKGDKGDTGNAATIAIGTVTKGDEASVVNVGTSANAIFNMVLPKGDKGEQGNPTVVNGKSGESITLFTNDFYMVGYEKPEITSPIETTDNVMQAIGKLEKAHDVLDDEIADVTVKADKVDSISAHNEYTIPTSGWGDSSSLVGVIYDNFVPDFELASGTKSSGVTFTDNGDGSFTLDGTTSSSVEANFKIINKTFSLPAGTYRFLLAGNSRLWVSMGTGFWSDSYGEKTYDSSQNSINFQLAIPVGTVFNNTRFRPVITTNTSLTRDDIDVYNPPSSGGVKITSAEAEKYPKYAKVTTDKYDSNFIPQYIDVIPSGNFFTDDEEADKGLLSQTVIFADDGFYVFAEDVPSADVHLRIGGVK